MWNTLRRHALKTNGVRAAVAYFARNGANLLPLKKGDSIVVDLSLGAVRQGVTDPRAVKTLMRRGVAVFSRSSSHAKFLIAGCTLIASSANVSRKSNEILDEAGIVTDDSAAVQRANDFFETLCTEPVGPKYISECIKQYRPPRFKAAIEGLPSRHRSHRIPEAKLWFEFHPDNARALYFGASMLAQLGECARSLEWAQRALKTDPEEPSILYNVACVYVLLGRTEEAIGFLEKSLMNNPWFKSWAEKDSDLDSLRGLPRFQALLKPL